MNKITDNDLCDHKCDHKFINLKYNTFYSFQCVNCGFLKARRITKKASEKHLKESIPNLKESIPISQLHLRRIKKSGDDYVFCIKKKSHYKILIEIVKEHFGSLKNIKRGKGYIQALLSGVSYLDAIEIKNKYSAKLQKVK